MNGPSADWASLPLQGVPTDSPQWNLPNPAGILPTPQVTEDPRTTLPSSPTEGLGFKPAGPELWQALVAAQIAAKELGHDASVGSERKELYAYTSSEAFIREARTVLHAHGLLVLQLGTIGAHIGKALQRLHTSYLLIHAPSGQGVVLPHEWPIHSSEKFPPQKSTGAAYTSSLRYFLRGLLMIVTTDTIEETDPDAVRRGSMPATPWHQPPQLPYTQQGWNPPPQGQGQWQPPVQPPVPAAPSLQHMVQVAQQELQATPVTANGTPQWTPPPQGQWQPQPVQGVPAPVPQQAPPPAALAQQAARIPAGLAAEGGKPPGDLRPGEPVEADEWVSALVRQGWVERDAEQLCAVNLDKPITETMREVVRGWIERYYGDDPTSATKAWIDAGFTPRPDLPEGQRPRPTGRQTLRYLHAMNWAARSSAAR